MVEQTFVIVGASLAGAKAAQGLREGGFDGRVVMIGEESEEPYERPELSKQFLLGGKEFADLRVHEPGYYAEHDIDLRTGTVVTGIERASRTVVTDDGQSLHYDRLLLATGAASRNLPLPGAGLAGVMSLRTVSDAVRLRERVGRAERVIVVGTGWIGCEVAASARTLGAEVTMISPDEYPLVRVLGPEVGRVFQDLHEGHGVDLHLNTGVESIVGKQRAEGVRMSGGAVVAGDLVLIAVGAVPRDELARAAGIEVDNGIVVDEYLQSSDPRIFAAGDVANAWHPVLGTRLRVEHWDSAIHQGLAAAANMLGQSQAYTKLPFFYSDQYEFGMEYRGHAASTDQVVLRGAPESREFLAFWLRKGRVCAAMNANIWDSADGLNALVRSDANVDPRQLADASTDLVELAAAAGR